MKRPRVCTKWIIHNKNGRLEKEVGSRNVISKFGYLNNVQYLLSETVCHPTKYENSDLSH